MSDTRLGPVDLYLLGLPTELPDPAALGALIDLVDKGVLRLLDLLLISRSDEGDVTIVELDALPESFGLDESLLGAVGLIGHEDIADLAASVPLGASALLVAVELAYQRQLATATTESGATLLGYERIPAPVVNALIDTLTLTPEE